MGMDRNTVIGFVLLGLLLFAYLYNSTKNSQELQKQRQLMEDSIARVKIQQEALAKNQDTSKHFVAPVDTAGLNKALGGEEKLLTVENETMKIVFSNKGGQPKEIELKNFKTYDSGLVKILDPAAHDVLSYSINTTSNQAHQVADLFFSDGQVQKNSDGSQTVSFQLAGAGGESITHQYIIPSSGYLLDWNILLNNPEKFFTQNNLNVNWHAAVRKTQQNVVYERQQSSICFYEDNNFDYIASKSEKKFEKPVQWDSI